jgi:hypothetical protein
MCLCLCLSLSKRRACSARAQECVYVFHFVALCMCVRACSFLRFASCLWQKTGARALVALFVGCIICLLQVVKNYKPALSLSTCMTCTTCAPSSAAPSSSTTAGLLLAASFLSSALLAPIGRSARSCIQALYSGSIRGSIKTL